VDSGGLTGSQFSCANRSDKSRMGSENIAAPWSQAKGLQGIVQEVKMDGERFLT
jgi:hypothetical protein